MTAPTTFNAAAFAVRLARAMKRAKVSARALAGQLVDVSHVTISRACRAGGWPTLSAHAYLQLEGWLAVQDLKDAA